MSEKDKKSKKAADRLVEIASDCGLFHAPDGTPFASLDINGHRENWPVRSKGFKQWLAREYYTRDGTAAASDAVQTALTIIEGKARFDGAQALPYIRAGGDARRIYIDLCDRDWRAVEIDAEGWRIIEGSPVKFRRAAGMKALPAPVRGLGGLERLQPFLNLENPDDFVLIKAWLVQAVRPDGPFPILAFVGEQGAAKSTASKVMKSIIDPNAAALRTFPRDERDLYIAACNGHVLAFDNVSRVSPWLSDALCRLATGGGFATRQLHTDTDEILFDAQRPIICNGIGDFLDRADAADRAILIKLAAIPEDRRRTERDIWNEFNAALPAILAGLYDAVSEGLAALPHVQLDRVPRMADFAAWAVACEAAHSDEGAFMKAYAGNRDEAVYAIADSDEVASGVIAHMATFHEWTGTATELFHTLWESADESTRRGSGFPKSAKALSERLTRAAPVLRKVGIDVHRDKASDRARTRKILLTNNRNKVESASAPSGASYPSLSSEEF
ncbi:hypothetical protein ACFOOP_10245 [Marinicaulis aureus]|uniref:ATP-binding protein n=1 Tax=Hyphococcus aureus TaxID=2666033 RepID=A0ABW1L0Q1_9PROT